jgi:mRNA-degrading endonuclease RelE of RelBE toxin-antitoxin system
MNYKLIVHIKAIKDIQQLSTINIKRAESKIEQLVQNPRPPGYKNWRDSNQTEPQVKNVIESESAILEQYIR